MSLINLLTPGEYARLHHEPITTLAEAKAFIEMLAKHGLMFHFDDGPEGIIWALPANQHPTDADNQALRARVNECYQPTINWANDGECPIGYCLVCLENTGDIPA